MALMSAWMVGDVVEQHGYTMPAYLRAGCHKHMKRALTRFRLSHAPIAVNTQSYAVPYGDRVCNRCDSRALDTEQHMFFECTSQVRSRPDHSRLLGKCNNIRELMQMAYIICNGTVSLHKHLQTPLVAYGFGLGLSIHVPARLERVRVFLGAGGDVPMPCAIASRHRTAQPSGRSCARCGRTTLVGSGRRQAGASSVNGAQGCCSRAACMLACVWRAAGSRNPPMGLARHVLCC